MSDIPRYRPVANDKYGITDDVDGKLCEYRDYARLKAEVERLRNAGDNLYKSMLEIGCNEMADNFQYDDWWRSMREWQSAKEGKPSV